MKNNNIHCLNIYIFYFSIFYIVVTKKFILNTTIYKTMIKNRKVCVGNLGFLTLTLTYIQLSRIYSRSLSLKSG